MASRKQAVVDDLHALLCLFEDVVPDTKSNRRLVACILDPELWNHCNRLFHELRPKTLQADRDIALLAQYAFEEVWLKTLHNLTNPDYFFDRDSIECVVPNARYLARQVGIPEKRVIAAAATLVKSVDGEA